MSTRFKHRQIDGDESDMTSALEMAIDLHWFVLIVLGSISTESEL